MKWLLAFFLAATGFRLAPAAPASPSGSPPQSVPRSFYEGKTIRLIVGMPAGGGYDTYSRAIARHLGKHLPGRPTILVENMPGAGSLIAANYLQRMVKPDGLTFGTVQGGLLMPHGLHPEPGGLDPRRFEYVGAPARASLVCALARKGGVTNMREWMTAPSPIKLGITSQGGTMGFAGGIVKTLLGLPVRLVSGYKGTAEIRLAVESGEVAGGCWDWDSMRSTWRRKFASGEMVAVLQLLPKPHPDLPTVPLVTRFVKTELDRRLIQVGVHHVSTIARPYLLPPGTPKERVLELRKAFQATLRDREFLEDARTLHLELDPLSGEELEKAAAELCALPPAFRARLTELFDTK